MKKTRDIFKGLKEINERHVMVPKKETQESE